MSFVNRFFIKSDLSSNSKVGSQFQSVLDHLTIHLFDHNHFIIIILCYRTLASWFSVLGSWLLALESQALTSVRSAWPQCSVHASSLGSWCSGFLWGAVAGLAFWGSTYSALQMMVVGLLHF